MITTVSWQYILLNGDSTTGYRVKRRMGGPPPTVNSGTDTPMADSWVSTPAPPQIHYTVDGKDYIFAFWSLSAHDTQATQTSAQIQTGNVANDSHSGGQWVISAKAYYIWNFAGGGPGGGGGGGPLLIDAFDIQAGDFFADDFVDVTPDQNGKLTSEANNGFIDTASEIPSGSSIKVTARGAITAKAFAYWFNIGSLQVNGTSSTPATVGSPAPADIVVHRGDRVIAFAFYNEVKRQTVVPPYEAAYNPWWWIETLGGLVPPPPRDPFFLELVAVAAVVRTASGVAPRLRGRILEVAIEQLSMAAAALKKQIASLEK